VILAGCPTQTTNGSGTELTTAQKDAVTAVAAQLQALGAVWGTCSELASTPLDLNPTSQNGTFGDCPAVTLVSTGPQTLAMKLDFGATGCSSNATANQTVSGAVKISMTRGTRTASIEFEDLTVAGKAITGTVSVTLDTLANGVRLAGTCDITTAQIGSASGSLTVEITKDGLITLTTGDVTVSDGTTSYAVALANLVCDPLNNGNFLPESGTATFEVPNEGRGPATLTVVVTFTSQTPVHGTVPVSIAGSQPVAYQLPGVIGG
jgi:hypothetical protein